MRRPPFVPLPIVRLAAILSLFVAPTPGTFTPTAAAAAAAAATAAPPPIAITEVHSFQNAEGTVALKADWWELTNFGTTPVDLSGSRFNDASGGLATGSVLVESLVLGASESVILLEQSATDSSPTAADFRTWWGPSLPAALRIFTYATNGIGLSSGGDSVSLWAPGATDEQRDLMDRVEFGAGNAGFTIVPDPATGLFGTISTAASPGAIASVEGGDIGSPGSTSGPVPLAVAEAPAALSVNPGDPATFKVVAHGLPRPRYQWQRNGVDLPGAIAASLTVSNVTQADTGDYRVVLANGLATVTSAAAALGIREQPTPPTFTVSPTNLVVVEGGTATFVAAATGVPQPTYQWSFQGTPIPGATDATLVRPNATAADAGEYRITATNPTGTITATATLNVRAKPRIRITEVHSASTETVDPDFARRVGTTLASAECGCATPEPDRVQALAFPMEDWFELTSFDSAPISIQGWRLDDNSARIANAYTITNDLVIGPGESIILTERLTPDQFRFWWGTNDLPAGLQIVTYTGGGLGLSSGGDGLRLWDAEATDDTNTVASVDFPAGEPGVSFNFDPDLLTFGTLSVNGVNGVVQAPGSIDSELNITYKNLGSPGRIREGAVPPPAPRLTFARTTQGTQVVIILSLPVLAGRTYELQSRPDVLTGAWTAVGTALQPTTAGTGTFEIPTPAAGSGSAFFRVAVR